MSWVLSVGFGNYVNFKRVIAIVNAESAPVKRALQQAIKDGNLIDSTQGRKTKSVVFMDTGHVVSSCLTTETLAKRAQDTQIEDNLEDA